MSTLLAVGMGLQAASQIQQGRIAEAEGEVAKDIAERNKKALDRQAVAEKEAARHKASQISRKAKIYKAMQRARMGGSVQGSSLAFLTDTAYQFSLERSLALRGGLIRGQELTERGNITLAQGRWAATSGRATKRASILGAAGSATMAAGLYGMGGTTTTKPGGINYFARRGG